MDAWVKGIAATEMVANAAGIVAGAGLLVVAAKKGGTWAVVKTVAAGAAAIAIDRGGDAGLVLPARASRRLVVCGWPPPSSRL